MMNPCVRFERCTLVRRAKSPSQRTIAACDLKGNYVDLALSARNDRSGMHDLD
jgi:hypothetical protein